MADFDAIYEDVQDEEPIPPPNIPKLEPIIIRGTGNMTVYVIFMNAIFFIFLFFLHLAIAAVVQRTFLPYLPCLNGKFPIVNLH